MQVPYRYFPIEPHWMMPGFQFLPAAVRTNLSQRDWTYHKYHPANSPQGDALAIELLTITEMRYYFPRSTILREKLGGLVKSLIATA